MVPLGMYSSLAIAIGLIAGALVVRTRKRTMQNREKTGRSRLIFLGSGCSGGTPIALCLLGLIPGRPKDGCEVCRSAYQNPTHPNNRRNPCVLIQNPPRTLNTLIDCGKTFREAALTWFPKFNVKGIDHIILTHEHADAVFGLDEIRMVQHISKTSPLRSNPPPQISSTAWAESREKEIHDVVFRATSAVPRSDVVDKQRQDLSEKAIVQGTQSKSHPLGAMYDDVTVHCMERTQKAVMTSFPYLVSKGKGAVPRFVSQLTFEPFDLNFEKPFYINDFFQAGEHLQIFPLPVEHGADFMCAGFVFGRRDVVVYISDVSKIPDETMNFIRKVPKIKLYVIDSLRPVNYEKASRPMVHFDLDDALASIRQIGNPPELTLLIGMGHEFDYATTNTLLDALPQELYGKVQCSRDGLALDLDL